MLGVSTFPLHLAVALTPFDALLIAGCPLCPTAEGMLVVNRASSSAPALTAVWHVQTMHALSTMPMGAMIAGMVIECLMEFGAYLSLCLLYISTLQRERNILKYFFLLLHDVHMLPRLLPPPPLTRRNSIFGERCIRNSRRHFNVVPSRKDAQSRQHRLIFLGINQAVAARK